MHSVLSKSPWGNVNNIKCPPPIPLLNTEKYHSLLKILGFPEHELNWKCSKRETIFKASEPERNMRFRNAFYKLLIFFLTKDSVLLNVSWLISYIFFHISAWRSNLYWKKTTSLNNNLFERINIFYAYILVFTECPVRKIKVSRYTLVFLILSSFN